MPHGRAAPGGVEGRWCPGGDERGVTRRAQDRDPIDRARDRRGPATAVTASIDLRWRDPRLHRCDCRPMSRTGCSCRSCWCWTGQSRRCGTPSRMASTWRRWNPAPSSSTRRARRIPIGRAGRDTSGTPVPDGHRLRRRRLRAVPSSSGWTADYADRLERAFFILAPPTAARWRIAPPVSSRTACGRRDTAAPCSSTASRAHRPRSSPSAALDPGEPRRRAVGRAACRWCARRSPTPRKPGARSTAAPAIPP